ncbi:MAG: alkaline phosphatase [Candidatus Nomurabacteria bacterium]|nr:alkaline phosphatase [Candidatus Nomurabacteria bacterium]
MPDSLVQFITHYGYFAIFGLVFLQEIGIPNPVANELVLLFAGSLAYAGTLSFTGVFFSAILGDIIGTSILYFVFYHLGNTVFEKKPKWIPLSREKIERLGERVRTHGGWGVFVGRLLPFVRGYASVAAGLFRLKPRPFYIAVISSALLWTGGYVTLGSIFGKYWVRVAETSGGVEKILLIAVAVTIIILGTRAFVQHRAAKKTNAEH